MTTRVLQAFDTLDSHSKSTLDILAKKNRQLTQMSTQCFAHGRSFTGLGLHREFSARKKPKANEEIVSDKQDLLYKRLRKSLAVEASMKGSSCSKSVEAGSTRVIIHPEKHTSHVKSSTGHATCGGKEDVGISFSIMPKKPQTLKPESRSPRKMAWLREVEKVPSLHELTKVNRSKALVGTSLGNTDIYHWCSTSVHSEVDASFKSPVPDGWMNTQQLQESTDNISIGASTLHNKTEKEVCVEPVPLSFDDLLMRNDVKVLAPRLHKDFLVNTFCIKFMTKPWLNGKANDFYTVMWKNLYPYGFERKNENVYLFLQIIHKDILQEVNNQITIQNQVKTVH